MYINQQSTPAVHPIRKPSNALAVALGLRSNTSRVGNGKLASKSPSVGVALEIVFEYAWCDDEEIAVRSV